MAALTGCAPTPIRNDGYNLVFNDDFNGNVLNTNVWEIAPFGSSLPGTVGFNVLTLRSTAANDYSWGYLATTGARSTTEPNYPNQKSWQEGYFEARVRYTNNPWAWPTFWLYSMAKTEAWPNENCAHLDAEWDIMENGAENSTMGGRPADTWYFTSLHRNTSDGTADGYCGQPDTIRDFSQNFTGAHLSDWHVWAGRWTSGQMCTYVDDILMQCMDTYDSTAQPMHLVFSIQYLQNCPGCPARPPELDLQVDWVRIWHR